MNKQQEFTIQRFTLPLKRKEYRRYNTLGQEIKRKKEEPNADHFR